MALQHQPARTHNLPPPLQAGFLGSCRRGRSPSASPTVSKGAGLTVGMGSAASFFGRRVPRFSARNGAATLLLLSVVAVLAGSASPAVAAGDHPQRCGDVLGGPGRVDAESISAGRVGCPRARRVARSYLRFNDVTGWRCRTRRSGRRICRRGCMGVAFNLFGEGVAQSVAASATQARRCCRAGRRGSRGSAPGR